MRKINLTLYKEEPYYSCSLIIDSRKWHQNFISLKSTQKEDFLDNIKITKIYLGYMWCLFSSIKMYVEDSCI
jgi:hypothetical protein